MKRQLRKPHLIVAMTMFLLVTGCGREYVAADDEDEELLGAVSVHLPEGTSSFADYKGEVKVAIESEESAAPQTEGGIFFGKKFIQKHCKGLLAKQKESNARSPKERLEVLLENPELPTRCRKAAELVLTTIKFVEEAKAEGGGDL